MSEPQSLPTWLKYLIGGVAAVIETFFTNPLSMIKLSIQQKRPIPRTIKELYAGIVVNMLGFAPTTAVQVGSTAWMDRHVFADTPTHIQTIYSAFTGGILSSPISGAVELIMAKQKNNLE